MRGLLIPSGEDPIEERTLASLPDYQLAVDGWIEAIDLFDVGITIYVNEEGLLRQLPFNPRATFLWWYHQAAARQQTMLVGNALVVGLPDRHGESTDVPGSVAELFLRPGLWRVEVPDDRRTNLVPESDDLPGLLGGTRLGDDDARTLETSDRRAHRARPVG